MDLPGARVDLPGLARGTVWLGVGWSPEGEQGVAVRPLHSYARILSFMPCAFTGSPGGFPGPGPGHLPGSQ